jgi:hypothetical protein
MNAIDLLIHCDLEPVPMKQMPTTWHEPAPDAATVREPVEVIYQSPPCLSYSRPLRRPNALAGAK